MNMDLETVREYSKKSESKDGTSEVKKMEPKLSYGNKFQIKKIKMLPGKSSAKKESISSIPRKSKVTDDKDDDAPTEKKD